MPINEKMMQAMKKEYGKKKGKSIFYAMEEMRRQKMKKKGKKK